MKIKISGEARKILLHSEQAEKLSKAVMSHYAEPKESFKVDLGGKSYVLRRVGLLQKTKMTSKQR